LWVNEQEIFDEIGFALLNSSGLMKKQSPVLGVDAAFAGVTVKLQAIKQKIDTSANFLMGQNYSLFFQKSITPIEYKCHVATP
jgi:hypothetical protein